MLRCSTAANMLQYAPSSPLFCFNRILRFFMLNYFPFPCEGSQFFFQIKKSARFDGFGKVLHNLNIPVLAYIGLIGFPGVGFLRDVNSE